MLLKALYDLAQTRRLFETVHLQVRTVHLLIPIDSQGVLLGDGVVPLFTKDEKGKDRLGRALTMPRFPGENNGGKSLFLADSCTTILGVEKDTGEDLTVEGKRIDNAAKSFLHFWQRVGDAEVATKLAELKALLEFKARYIKISEGVVHPAVPFLDIRPNKRGVPELGALTSVGTW